MRLDNRSLMEIVEQDDNHTRLLIEKLHSSCNWIDRDKNIIDNLKRRGIEEYIIDFFIIIFILLVFYILIKLIWK